MAVAFQPWHFSKAIRLLQVSAALHRLGSIGCRIALQTWLQYIRPMKIFLA